MLNHGHDGWQPTMPGPTTPPPAVRPAHQVPANVQNMSLRDHIAVQVMLTLLDPKDPQLNKAVASQHHREVYAFIARESYLMAEAMMEARKSEQ